ncbi:hypothetical protein B0H14DRAFT_2588493 [Mycena olivaceomarginata]|nr:hypothetical protein B0H14DRAFT_2588493 [Mycena olivaceomarginata]
MAYNPDNPNASSPAVLYVVAAVGPPSDDLLEAYYSCDYGFTHILQIFTGQRDPDATGKIGQFNVYCAPPRGQVGKCHTVYGQIVTLSLARTLRAGLEQLPHLLPKGDANRDAALDIARNLGQIARDNWQNAHHGESVHAPVKAAKGKSKAKAPAARNGKNVIKAIDAAAGKGKQMSQVKANPTAAAEPEEPVHIPYDEYCAITYATAGLQPRLIKLIGFIQPNTPPTIDYAWLRFLGRFEVSKFPFAVTMGMVGPDPVVFERWCIFSRTWKLENLEPINMTERGECMIYRAGFLLEEECVGLAKRKTLAQDSATFQFDAADDDGDVEVVSSSPVASSSQSRSGPGSSSSRASVNTRRTASSQGGSSGAAPSASGSSGKRRRSHTDDREVGSSTRPFRPTFLEEEEARWEHYNEEDFEG